METLLILCMWAQFGSAMLLFGGSLFRFQLGERAWPIDRSFSIAQRVATLIAIVSALGWLMLEAAAMGEGWSDAVNPSAILTVLRETDFGRVWVVRLVLALFLVVIAIVPPSRRAYGLGVAFAGLFLASLALTGHAIMGDGITNVLHSVTQAVHLLAGGGWLGALLPLFLCLCGANNGNAESLAPLSVKRFARLGYVSVALVLASGIINSWFLLAQLNDLFFTQYGRVLLLKIAFVGAMLLCAVVNRFKLAPTITQSSATRMRLMQSVVLEATIGAVVLAVASFLGNLPPP